MPSQPSRPPRPPQPPRHVVVVGNGPVGFALLQNLAAGTEVPVKVTALCEERWHAYNRVAMTSYFSHRSAAELAMCDTEWYSQHNVDLIFGKATVVDRASRYVLYTDIRTGSVNTVRYDELVFATGSAPFVPRIPGLRLGTPGIFVYRTIDDMEAIIERARTCKGAAVIGGGLLGLEAAKAMRDLGLRPSVLEVAPQLMAAQLDREAGRLLKRKVEALGVDVHVGIKILQVLLGEDGGVAGLHVSAGGEEFLIECSLLIVSCGVRPRDELARECGLELGSRGGIKVDGQMRSTSDPHVYAVGEVASHMGGMVYGLWKPGCEQAEVLAATLASPSRELEYRGSDLSTKLKLLGVEVASFGVNASFWLDRVVDCEERPGADKWVCAMIAADAAKGTYRKLVFARSPTGGRRLIGGVLVDSNDDYAALLELARSGRELWGLEAEVLAHGMHGSTPMLIEESVYPMARL